MEYCGFIDSHSDIRPGMFVEITGVEPTYYCSYPPVGSVVPVTTNGENRRPVLDCRDYDLGLRTGYGLKYVVVATKVKLRGVAEFLKERNL